MRSCDSRSTHQSLMQNGSRHMKSSSSKTFANGQRRGLEERCPLNVPRCWGLCCKKEADLGKFPQERRGVLTMKQENLFKWRHFQAEIIRMSHSMVSSLCFKLSRS